MNRKCLACGFINFSTDLNCRRCHAALDNQNPDSTALAPGEELGKKLDRTATWFFKRFFSALIISFALLLAAYVSMLSSAAALTDEQQQAVNRAIEVLKQRGFDREAWLLGHSSFRSTDNWFNAMTGHNDAYAATNFPFEIVTLYADFFKMPVDDTERAAILLHEAQHLQGLGEPGAYEAVWRSRAKLGWTRATHGNTRIYGNVSRSTKQYAPELFVCQGSFENDCTE